MHTYNHTYILVNTCAHTKLNDTFQLMKEDLRPLDDNVTQINLKWHTYVHIHRVATPL